MKRKTTPFRHKIDGKLLRMTSIVLLAYLWSMSNIVNTWAYPSWLKEGAYFIYEVSTIGYVETVPTLNDTIRAEIVSISEGRATIRYASSHPLLSHLVGNYVVDIQNREILSGPASGGKIGLWVPADIEEGDDVEIGLDLYTVEGIDEFGGREVWVLTFAGIVEGIQVESRMVYDKQTGIYVAEATSFPGLGEISIILVETSEAVIPPLIPLDFMYVIPIVAAIVAGIGFLAYRRRSRAPFPPPPPEAPSRLLCPRCEEGLIGDEEFCPNCGLPLKGFRK